MEETMFCAIHNVEKNREDLNDRAGRTISITAIRLFVVAIQILRKWRGKGKKVNNIFGIGYTFVASCEASATFICL
jgi:hypothetical protein